MYTRKPDISPQAESAPRPDGAPEGYPDDRLREDEEILSPDQRRVMLEEIARVGLTLGRALTAPKHTLSSATPKTGSATAKPQANPVKDKTIPVSPQEDVAQTATPLERLHLLETLWPEIELALARLIQPPRSKLTDRPVPTLIERSRGGSSIAVTVARTPDIGVAWSHRMRLRTSELDTRAAGNARASTGLHHPLPRPLHLQERRPQAGFDTLLNRFIVMLLMELERETQHLAMLSAFCADEDGRDRARSMGRSVAHWRAASPFSLLTPLSAQEWLRLRQTGRILQWEAAGRALYTHWLALHRPLHFDWSHSPLLELPALEAWHLYEIWCFMTVIGCLIRQGWEPLRNSPAGKPITGIPITSKSEQRTVIHCAPDGLRLRLATGQASELKFRRAGAGAGRHSLLTLTYQPFFPSANQSRSDADYSLSHAMQPDIALQWRSRIYLLDAKYRRYAPREQPGNAATGRYNALLEDIDKMHTYRDSIVQRGRRVVRQAWCLFPGSEPSDQYPDDPAIIPKIIAYPAGTLEQPFGAAGIGAISLRPGQTAEILSRLLADWLSDSKP